MALFIMDAFVMSSSSLAAVIIGNEILAGRRNDAHLAATVAACNARGLRLQEVVYLGDDHGALVAAFRRLHAGGAMILSFGGIGATPDDKTRQAVAEVLDVPLALQPEGLASLERRFGAELNDTRRQLVAFPQGASLIPNPVNEIPGFSIAGMHCVPGFPQMATPMVAWVLDRYGRHLQQERFYQALLVELPESEAVALITALEAQFAEVSISSLPQLRRRLELGFEGERDAVARAMAVARQWLREHQVVFAEL